MGSLPDVCRRAQTLNPIGKNRGTALRNRVPFRVGGEEHELSRRLEDDRGGDRSRGPVGSGSRIRTQTGDQLRARIVLAHGLDPMEYAALDALPGRVLKKLPEEARTVLDKLAGDLLQAGIHSHSEIRQGTVAQMLVDVARQYEAGLIVIGTKGWRAQDRWWWERLRSNW